MKKFALSLIVAYSFCHSGIINFSSDVCSIKYNTRTHEFLYEEKCLKRNGKEKNGILLECEIEVLSSTYKSRKGAFRVQVYIMEKDIFGNKTVGYLAYDKEGKYYNPYGEVEFSADMNNGVFNDCFIKYEVEIQDQ